MNVPARKPGPSVLVSVVIIVVGVLISLPAGIGFVVRAVKAVTAPSFAIPGEVDRHLGSGTWLVLERTDVAGFPPTVDTSQVSVTGPGGAVAVEDTTSSQTLTRGTRIFSAVFQFDAPVTGDYRIQFSNAEPSEAIISRPFGRTVRDIAGLAAIAAIGGLGVVLGVVLLIIGVARRHSAKSPPPMAAWVAPGAAAGWYPDPEQPGHQRWWDGTRWTDYRS